MTGERESHFEHSTHETLSFPRSRASEHLDTDASQTPDVGFRRIALFVVVNHCDIIKSGSVRCCRRDSGERKKYIYLREPSRRLILAWTCFHCFDKYRLVKKRAISELSKTGERFGGKSTHHSFSKYRNLKFCTFHLDQSECCRLSYLGARYLASEDTRDRQGFEE